jgi:hypothetical protein
MSSGEEHISVHATTLQSWSSLRVRMDTRRTFSLVYQCQQWRQDSVRVMRSARATIHMARHAIARQHHACRTRDFTRVFLVDSQASPPPLPSCSAEQEPWCVEPELILSERAERRFRLSCYREGFFHGQGYWVFSVHRARSMARTRRHAGNAFPPGVLIPFPAGVRITPLQGERRL